MDISLLLPTRKRVKQLTRFIESVIRHAECLSTIELILYIDEDDAQTQKIDFSPMQLRIIKKVGPRITMGGCNKACYNLSSGKVIMLVNDDVCIRTKGWDTEIKKIANQFPDDIYFLYPNDCFKKEKFPAFPILSKKTCQILREPFIEDYKGSFIDMHLFDIFIRIKHRGYNRICYLENVIFEHLHHRLKKSEMDDTYRQRQRFSDDDTFFRLKNLRVLQANRLIAAILFKEDDVPEFDPNLSEYGKVLNFFRNLGFFYIVDSGLPLWFRNKKFIYFFLRYIYRRITAQRPRQ